jgi:hypothetical protein
MPIAASLEHVLHDLIAGLAAFAALAPVPVIRPYKLAETDFVKSTGARAVIIESPEEDHEVSLDGLGGGVSAQATVEAVSEVFEDAWLIAETMRLNGTSPGTGLAGYSGTVAGLTIQRITVDRTMKGFAPYEDGSDEGFYYVRFQLTVDYSEAN